MTKVSTITACYKMGKYMEGFLDNLSQQTHKDLEVVIDHNDPTIKEVELIEEHNEKYDNIFHIQVDGVDPLGISWNRCIENSSGDYLCIWNVDDLRTPDSIEMMAKALDENPDVNFVYGNKLFVTFGAGNITDLNLLFPKVSGNFLLMLKQSSQELEKEIVQIQNDKFFFQI